MNIKYNHSNSGFCQFFSNSNAVMLLIDPGSHQIIDANPAAEKYYGWSHAQLTTMCIDKINTLSTAEIEAEMNKASTQKRSYFKFKHRKANGTVCPVEVFTNKVEIDGKEYLHSIVHDITDQEESNNKLHETNEYLENLFAYANAPIVVWDNSLTITRFNKAFEVLSGYSSGEVIGKHIDFLFPLSKKEKSIQFIKETTAGKRWVTIEIEILRKDGTVRTVIWNSSNILDSNKQKIVATIAQGQDITARVRAEQVLKESENRLAKMAEHTKTITWEIDTNGIFTYVSPMCEKLTGIKAEELVGHMHFFDLIHGADPSVLKQAFINLMKHEASITDSENIMKTKNGKEMWFATNAFPIYDEANQLKGYRGSNSDITLRKQTEKELFKSHELLKNLAEQVPGVIYQYQLFSDSSSAFVYASPGMWNIYEVTPEEVQNDTKVAFTRIHPDDYDYIVNGINESAKNLSLYQSEFRVILPQQGLRWRQCNAKPIKLDDGSVLWHGIITDITDRKVTEQKLLHFHDLMKYIIEHDRSAIAVHDRDLNYIYVSQRYLEQYNVQGKDIIGKHHYEVFPDLPEKWRVVHQKALKGEVSSADDDVYPKEDGTLVWTRWECRPWYESDGAIGGIIIYTEVINERKETELEIKKLNERLEILVHSVQVLSSAQSINEIQNIVVTAARMLIGADGATFVSKENMQCFYATEDSIAPLWAGKRFPIDSCISGWVMQNKQSVVIEDIYSDSRIPIEAYRQTFVKSLAMVPINLGEPLGAIGIYWKSEYKASEIELNLLQTLADSAARALENIRLLNEIEQKAIERTQRLEAVFLANMSHEIRTPLNSIMGFSSLLPDEESKEIIDQYSGIIMQNSEHLVHIIDNIVMYSRLQAKMLALQVQEFKICELLQNLIQTYNNQALQQGLMLIANNKIESEETFHSDFEKIRQIFSYLIANAFKYTTSGTIRIGAENHNGKPVFYVKDTGIGIPEDEVEKVFERFFRGSNTRKETVPGTGLGLSIVKELIELLGGKIWIESELGKGSTFFFTINNINNYEQIRTSQQKP